MKLKRKLDQITKINLSRMKIFALAGLMGLASCRDPMEPDAPKTNPNDSTENPPKQEQVDNFMKHVSDLDNACFCKPRDYNSRMLFEKDFDGSVGWFGEESSLRNWEYMYPTGYKRKSTDLSDTVGYFSIPAHTYSFSIELNDEHGYHRWQLINYPEVLYQTVSNNTLASIAQNNCADNAIYEGIKAGKGHWEQENPGMEGVQAAIESKGGKVGLKHSDFGVYDAQFRLHDSIMQKIGGNVEGLEGNIYHFARVYAGGVYKNNSADKMANAKYVGTGVAQLEETDGANKRIIYTNPGAASLVVDAQQNETIVMPFNNWYNVTIIKTPNHITMNLNETNTTVPNQWRVANPNITDFDASYGYQENGLYTLHSNNFEEPFKGSTGVEFEENDPENKNIGVRTSVATDYFGDTKSDPSEVIVQGYRTDRNFVNATEINGIFFGFVFGGVKQQQK